MQYMVSSHFGIQEENSLIIGDLGCPLDTVQEEKYLWVLISEDASSLPESPWSLTLTCRGGTVDPFVFVIITIIITNVTTLLLKGVFGKFKATLNCRFCNADILELNLNFFRVTLRLTNIK